MTRPAAASVATRRRSRLHVVLALSFNGVHFENTTFPYRYYAEPHLAHVSPSSGPAYGVQCSRHRDWASTEQSQCPGGASLGTLVTVSGGGFPSADAGTDDAPLQYRCRFGHVVVPGTLVDASSVRCHAPGSVEPGQVPLRVSPNALDFSLSNLTFTYEHTLSPRPSIRRRPRREARA